MRKIGGWEFDVMTLSALLEKVHPDDREEMAAAVRRAHDPRGEGLYSVEHRFVRKNGDIRQVSVRARTFFDGEGEARRPIRTIGAAVDITERKVLEDELRAAKDAAEEASRVKSEFLANVSHELRTPLTVIMTALEMMRTPGAFEDDPSAFLEMAESSAYRLLQIIDDLLDIIRLEARQMVAEKRPFDLRELVRQAMEPLAAGAKGKGLAFRWTVSPQIAPQLIGDPDRIRQVLVNLADNAVKFTDRGEVSLDVSATGDTVVFSVRDTGIGIPKEKLKLLFEPFTQVDSSLTRRHGGTGLGLAICKKLTELMGGTIRGESEAGRGSTFTFSLPLPPAPAAGKPVAGSAGPKRILLAEDDPSIRKLIEEILRVEGYAVVTAENGTEAVERYEDGKIDLVLMDLQMPGMDGLSATEKIRALEKETGGRLPILALTAHARPEDKEACLAAGMDGFLTKPIRAAELCARVESCLYNRCRPPL